MGKTHTLGYKRWSGSAHSRNQYQDWLHEQRARLPDGRYLVRHPFRYRVHGHQPAKVHAFRGTAVAEGHTGHREEEDHDFRIRHTRHRDCSPWVEAVGRGLSCYRAEGLCPCNHAEVEGHSAHRRRDRPGHLWEGNHPVLGMIHRGANPCCCWTAVRALADPWGHARLEADRTAFPLQDHHPHCHYPDRRSSFRWAGRAVHRTDRLCRRRWHMGRKFRGRIQAADFASSTAVGRCPESACGIQRSRKQGDCPPWVRKGPAGHWRRQSYW